MNYLYVLFFIFKLVLCHGFISSRVKLTEIKNLTKELLLYKYNELLPWQNPSTKLTHYVASLLPSNKDPRVVGGRVVNIRERSFTSYLILKRLGGLDFRGGAVIVGKHWALTAAHCLDFINSQDIKNKAAFVFSNTSYWNRRFSQHRITAKYAHEKYNPEELDYDIALIKVSQPFNGKYEKPIKFAGKNYKYETNSLAYVIGWGSIDPTDYTVTEQLREATLRLSDFKECQKKYEKKLQLVTNRMICAADKGKDACVYDSGGPLVQNGVLIGLVSWGTEVCADEYFPGVYTRVSSFNQWLRKKMGIRSGATRKNDFSRSHLNMSIEN